MNKALPTCSVIMKRVNRTITLILLVWIVKVPFTFVQGKHINRFAEDLSFIDNDRDALVSNNTLNRRDFSGSLHLLTWSATDGSGENAIKYNISVAVGGCGRGANYGTSAGIYTFTDGRTKRNATVGDIVMDLKHL